MVTNHGPPAILVKCARQHLAEKKSRAPTGQTNTGEKGAARRKVNHPDFGYEGPKTATKSQSGTVFLFSPPFFFWPESAVLCGHQSRIGG